MGGLPRGPGGLLLLLLCAQGALVAANVRADNFHSRHLLHSEHDRFFEMLAAAPAGQVDGVWHYNDENAPLVSKTSIEKARVMEMADDAAADEAAKAAKKASEFEEHKAINAEVVARLTAPYRGDNPVLYLVKGFGMVLLITVGFYFAEMYWLKETLSLPTYFNNPDIAKRMYPLF